MYTSRNTPKIEGFKSFPQIKEAFEHHKDALYDKSMPKRWFYRKEILPRLEEGESLQESTALNWIDRQLLGKTTSAKGDLIQQEMDKVKEQHFIRQDVTAMMHSFIKAVRKMADDPEALKQSGIKIDALYKIIREEEDRYRNLNLKERSENRADAQFAFMVSVAKAGEVSDEDIAFLEEDLRGEIMKFKKINGSYQLPISSQLSALEVPAENSIAVADQGTSSGA